MSEFVCERCGNTRMLVLFPIYIRENEKSRWEKKFICANCLWEILEEEQENGDEEENEDEERNDDW